MRPCATLAYMTATLIEAPSHGALRNVLAPRPIVTVPRLRAMRYEPEPGTAGADPPHRTRPGPVPPIEQQVFPDRDTVRAAVAAVIRVALEVLDGRRPLAQLDRHLDAAALRYWTAATQRRRPRSPARVVRIVLGLPRPDAAEVATVCEIDGRVRALAARFERTGPAAPWRCVTLRLG